MRLREGSVYHHSTKGKPCKEDSFDGKAKTTVSRTHFLTELTKTKILQDVAEGRSEAGVTWL